MIEKVKVKRVSRIPYASRHRSPTDKNILLLCKLLRINKTHPHIMAKIKKRMEIYNCSLLQITGSEFVRAVTNVAVSSTAASREAYRTIGVQGRQKHCRN